MTRREVREDSYQPSGRNDAVVWPPRGLGSLQCDRASESMRMRIRARVTLAALVAVLAFAAGHGPARAASWPAWAREAEDAARSQSMGQEDAVVLLDQWEMTLKEGERSGTRRWVIRVLTEDGRSHALLPLARGPFERFDKVKAWIRYSSGRVLSFGEDEGTLFSYSDHKLLDDTEVLIVEPRGVTPGCTVAVQYGFTSSAEIPQDAFEIQSSIPVLRSTVKVESVRGWKVYAKVAPGANPGPSEVDGTGTWIFTNVPGRRSSKDPDAPEPPRTQLALDYVPPQGTSSFSDWGATARWGAALFGLGTRASPEPQLEREFERLRAAGGDPVEEVGKLTRRLRYFGIEIGWGGYRPRAPETTLSRAFGDCKDKSQLMVYLLRRLGVEAVPVLAISATDRYVDEGLPGPRQFNHCVVGIPWLRERTRSGMTVVEAPGVGLLRIYDPTLSESSPQDTSVDLEGGASLVLSARTTGLLRLPGSSAEDNILETVHAWRLDASGTLHVVMTSRFHGAFRSRLEGEGGDLIQAADLRESLFEVLAQRSPAFKDLQIGPIRREASGFWSYEASYQVPGALEDWGGVHVLDLFPLVDTGILPVPDDEKEGSLYQPLLATRRDRFEIALEGRPLAGLPEAFEVKHAIGRVALEVHLDQGRLLIEREFRAETREIAYAARAQARALRQALGRLNAVSLRFGQAAGAHSDAAGESMAHPGE